MIHHTNADKRSLFNKKVLVIGLGISGRSAAGFLMRKGAKVTAVDKNIFALSKNADVEKLIYNGLKTALPENISSLNDFDLIVVSPGIPETDPLYSQARLSGIEVIGEVELAFRYINNTVLAITGTNGKTTVTLLVAHILNQSGRKASALGNSGIALTSLEAEQEILSDTIIVAELSSYQLDTLNSRVIDCAVLLNITPDHLDRYGNMQSYAKSKYHISECIKDYGRLYVETNCHKEFGFLNHGFANTYGFLANSDIYCDLKSIFVNGQKECDLPAEFCAKNNHDVENIMAAYALCRYVGVSPQLFVKALSSFKKPAHRIEFVRKYKGIQFFDDSKGTNLDAVVKAVKTMNGPIILIAGGVDKGAAYTPWIRAFANKVKCICSIGQAATKIESDLSHAIHVQRFPGLKEAIDYAYANAQHGDNILLSPGCSSYDMFRDYAHRGEEFQRIVNDLL